MCRFRSADASEAVRDHDPEGDDWGDGCTSGGDVGAPGVPEGLDSVSSNRPSGLRVIGTSDGVARNKNARDIDRAVPALVDALAPPSNGLTR